MTEISGQFEISGQLVAISGISGLLGPLETRLLAVDRVHFLTNK